MREPLANPMGNRSLQRVVMKNVLVDKGGKLRFVARQLLGFAADARPDRIDFIEAPSRPRLILSHEPLSPGASSIPKWSFITVLQSPRELHKGLAHGSCALVKEVDNPGLIDLVADGKHVVAIRNIECMCTWN